MKRFKINSDKLKGLIVERRKTYKECADALGISQTQFGMKVRGEADFWISQACILSKFLELTAEEFYAVFVPGLF